MTQIIGYVVGGIILILGVLLGINKYRSSKITGIIEKAKDLIKDTANKTVQIDLESAKLEQKIENIEEQEKEVDTRPVSADEIKAYFDELEHKK